jgi:hypothetical protein
MVVFLWCNASCVTSFRMQESDGAVGSVGDFLFDDRDWTILWLVVDIGLLAPRSVLLPTSAIHSPSAAEHVLRVDATREQVKESPEIDMHAPVSRQNETDLYGYYGWSPYWAGYLYAPAGGVAAPVPPPSLPEHRPETEHRDDDPHLRSMKEVTGYYVHASDGDIGHMDCLPINDRSPMHHTTAKHDFLSQRPIWNRPVMSDKPKFAPVETAICALPARRSPAITSGAHRLSACWRCCYFEPPGGSAGGSIPARTT